MKVFIQEESAEKREYLTLSDELSIGRTDPGRGVPSPSPQGRGRRSDLLFLKTADSHIEELEEGKCQLNLQREGEAFFVEDRKPINNSCLLNGELFSRRKLLINDRISLGDGFHFLFDGIGLQRVPEKSGGRLEANRLTKTYTKGGLIGKKSTVAAIRNLTLTVEPNEFVGILGPSGCGKSTLLSMLSGSLLPTSGDVTINDDAAATISLPNKSGFIFIHTDPKGTFPQGQFAGCAIFDIGNTISINTAFGGSEFATANTDMTGTAGADGKLTVGAVTGALKIENRTGAPRPFRYTIIG